jgi:hypothetical protein
LYLDHNSVTFSNPSVLVVLNQPEIAQVTES